MLLDCSVGSVDEDAGAGCAFAAVEAGEDAIAGRVGRNFEKPRPPVALRFDQAHILLHSMAFLDHRDERVRRPRIELAVAAEADGSKAGLGSFADESDGAEDFRWVVAEDGGGEHVGQGISGGPGEGIGVHADAVITARRVVLGADGKDVLVGLDLDQSDADIAPPHRWIEQSIDEIGRIDQLVHRPGRIVAGEFYGAEEGARIEQRVHRWIHAGEVDQRDRDRRSDDAGFGAASHTYATGRRFSSQASTVTAESFSGPTSGR